MSPVPTVSQWFGRISPTFFPWKGWESFGSNSMSAKIYIVLLAVTFALLMLALLGALTRGVQLTAVASILCALALLGQAITFLKFVPSGADFIDRGLPAISMVVGAALLFAVFVKAQMAK